MVSGGPLAKGPFALSSSLGIWWQHFLFSMIIGTGGEPVSAFLAGLAVTCFLEETLFICYFSLRDIYFWLRLF